MYPNPQLKPPMIMDTAAQPVAPPTTLINSFPEESIAAPNVFPCAYISKIPTTGRMINVPIIIMP